MTKANQDFTGVLQKLNCCTDPAARNLKASSELQEIKPPQKSVVVGTINGNGMRMEGKKTRTNGEYCVQILGQKL